MRDAFLDLTAACCLGCLRFSILTCLFCRVVRSAIANTRIGMNRWDIPQRRWILDRVPYLCLLCVWFVLAAFLPWVGCRHDLYVYFVEFQKC